MAVTIKTPEEVERLRDGGRIHARILLALKAAVAPGVTTLYLNDLAKKMIDEGGDKSSFFGYTPYGADRPFPAVACISVNEEVIHGIPNERPKTLKEGDIVGIDVGLIHEGMITDSAITVPVGTIDQDSKMLIQATEEALYAGIRAAHFGNTIGDIGYAIAKVAKKYGFSIAEDLAGHGVGYAVHEEPYVPNRGTRGKGLALRPGMVLAIEPMFNQGTAKVVLMDDGYTYRTADNKRSAHFEHTILITTAEAEILTCVQE